MRFLLGLIGIACSVLLLKYREKAGELLGEAPWMSKVGGVYNLIIIIAVLLFFWSIAYMLNALDLFLSPLLWLLPGLGRENGDMQPDLFIN